MNELRAPDLPRTPFLSLRALLGAAALAALITAAALGVLLLVTAGAAHAVVRSAQETHDTVQVYSQLVSAARGYQAASYVVARVQSEEIIGKLETSRAHFLDALHAAENLPLPTLEQREAAAKIVQQGRYVAEHLARTSELVAQIDVIWRTQGSHAAMIAAENSAAPVRLLERMLEKEIRRGNEQIAAATSRALALNRTVVIACVICLCLATACWAIVHGLLLRRFGPGLRRLEEGTLALVAGDLGYRVGLGGHDELGRLSATFDAMAQQLADKQQKLQQVQANLERAVKSRTEQLERANAELSAADGRRRASSRISGTSCALRSRSSGVNPRSPCARFDQPGSNPQEAFERILEHTHDLTRMVDDLFLIARAEAGGLPMQMRPVDLRELTRRVADDFEALVIGSKASVTALHGPPIMCIVDPDRLRRALAALIDNALRHTHERVQVVIDVVQTENTVAITVCDDGRGVEPALVPELFQRFRRGHTQAEGEGLGLSLVRALVGAQGGQARLENRAEGGARATLEFRRVTLQGDRQDDESASG